ncbi:BON domain-containing protein [Methylocapsa palsarum]|uniref:Osmotically-inducible protein OsmY, contains BON domain n=1 Tax=Methylocapsa palsarum TaxID=1612308 RepID=A0A1I4B7R9_9HYPH|nr:BON domain-containing protein [Methylocapsa palsarum]SFK64573.1 Osmotically-inducible protein OsmY, contains BON domain [Methylocapsa palsarum]
MFDDKQLKQAVLDELAWEPSVNAAHIGVTAKNGVVTLMGHVEIYAQKSAAERATRRVKGVKAVAEELEVQLPFSFKRSDEEIAAAAIARLAWDAAVPMDSVKVKVEKGWVTLTGEVDWHYQQQSASDDIRGLSGVIGVSNDIKIKPRVNAENIREDIMVALHRSWFEPNRINVSSQGGKVQLTGSVHYWSEREEAGSTAWAAPGVISVENDIRVD